MTTGKVLPTLLALAVYVNVVLALPLKTCPAFECTGANDVFAFEPKKIYTYNLETQTSSVLSGANVQQGKLHLSSEVTLQAVSTCSAIVTVKKATILNGEKKHTGSTIIEGSPVLIGVQNGQLVSEFCANNADSLVSLNFKRAIASLFQIPTEQKQYTDIFGTCNVDSSVVNAADGTTQVNSFRNLNGCRHRESIISSIPSSTYNFEASEQSAPILKSTAQVEQRLKNKVLISASGHEEYHFLPYSNEGNGAIVTVSTNISLINTADGDAQFAAAAEPSSQSIIFEAPHGSNNDFSNSKNLGAAVDSACSAIESNNVDSAYHVRNLIQVVRQSSSNDLLKAYNTYKTKCGGKVLIDAILSGATGQTVEALVKLSRTKGTVDLDQLYISLAFNRHPTLASIKAIGTLLDKAAPRSLILGAGALIGKYHEIHGVGDIKEINDLLAKITKPLDNCVTKTHEEEDKVLTALKSLHNAHFIPESVTVKVKACLSKKVSARVRVAALDAVQSDAGNAQLKPTVLEILSDREEDSELRIKAYLVAATCPCGKVAEVVSNLIENEPVNQVGSFVATHLRNLRSSANPDKVGAKERLGSIRVPANKYKYDYRRFSTNNELSFSLGKEGVAASAESNVIFSQNSFLPRSADLNLTANVLGHSFNLLEVGLRAENLEHILEGFFGPKGYYNTRSADDVLNSGNDTVNTLAAKIRERASQSIRNKRSVDRSSLDKVHAKVHHEHDNNINTDLYLKLFGYELAFYSYYGDPTEFSPFGIVDKIFDRVDNTIKAAKDYNLEIDRNIQLIDTELTYPTLAGFPLKLTSIATASVKVELKTAFDLPAIVAEPQKANVHFRFIPSATIEAASEFYLDFHVATSGLKHAATIQTSNGVDLTFKLQDGKGFELNIGTPLAEQVLVHAKSELFSTSRDKGGLPVSTPIEFNIPRAQYHGCFDQLSNLVGASFCFELNYPNEGVPKKGSFFPLDGPAKLYGKITRDDPSQTAYNIQAKVHDDVANVRGWSLELSTPNSQSNRLYRFFFTLQNVFSNKDAPNKQAKLEFTTPIRSGYASLSTILNDQEKALEAIAKLDEDVYQAKLGLTAIGSTGDSTTYKPLLTYSAPGDDGSNKQYTVDGTITHDKGGNANKLTFSEVAVTIPGNKYQLDGFVLADPAGVEVDVVGKYNNLAESATLKSKIGRGAKDNFNILLKLSQFPDAAFSVVYEGINVKDLSDNKLKVNYGADLADEKHSVTIEQYSKAEREDEKITSVTTKNKLSYPAAGLYLTFDADAVRKKSFHYVLEAGYESQKLTSELSYKFNIPAATGDKDARDPGGFELLFKAGAAGRTVVINANRLIQTADTSKSLLSLEIQPDAKTFKVESDLIHRLDKSNLKLMVTSVFTITGIPDTYTVCTGVENQPERSQAHLKLSKGADEVLRINGETNRGDTITGKFEVFLKSFLDGSGTFTHIKSKNEGNLDATFNSEKLNRKVVVTGKVAPGAKATAREVGLVVLLDADKNPNNKLTLDSTIDLNKDGRSYDTKTTVAILDSTFVLALKGVVPNRTPLENGVLYKLDGSLELPSKQLFSAYIDLVQLKETEGRGTSTLVKFNDGKDYKLKYSARHVSVDGFEVPTFDLDNKLELSGNKKSLNVGLNIKNTVEGEKKTVVHKVDVSGSAIPEPFSSTFTAEIQDVPKYALKASYGAKVAIDADATFNFKNKIDQSYNLNFDLKSDFEGYKHVKYASTYKGSFGDQSFKGDASERLEIENARVYDIAAHVDYLHNDDQCKGAYKLTSFLGAEEKEPRVLSISHDLQGVTASVATDSAKPRKFVVDIGLSQANTAFEIKVDGDLPGDGTTKLGLVLNAPIENYKTIVIKLDRKSSGKLVEGNVELQFDNSADRHYLVHGKIDLSEVNRVFSVDVTKSDKSPLFTTLAAYRRPASNEIQGELAIKVSGSKPRSLVVDGVVKYPGGFEDFDVVVNIDSEDLKLNKVRVHLDGKNSAGKGRKINISVKSADKSLVEGSTTIQKKEEGQGTVYEGKGEVTLDGDKYSSDLRLSHKILQKGKDSENGFDFSLSGTLTGKQTRTLESQLLLTDKALRAFTKYCDAKCSQFEVVNTLKISDATEVLAENKIAIDFEHSANVFALSLGSKLQRKGLSFDHKIEAVLGKADKATKYEYEAFIKESSAGLHLTTPKRTIAIDGLFSTPGKGKSESSQNYKTELIVYLDKANEPDKKLSLLGSVDVTKGKDGTTYSSDIKLTHPLLEKPLTVKSKTLIGTGQVLLESSFNLDVFAKKNQAIVFSLKNERIPIDGGFNFTSTLTIASKAQGLDFSTVNHFVASKKEAGFGSVITSKRDNEVKEAAVIFAANIDSLLIFARSPSCEILRVHGDCKRQQGIPPKNSVFLSFLDTLNFEGEVIGYQSFKYQAYDKNTPDVRTVYSGAYEIEKELLLEADHLSAGNTAKLFRLRVALDKEHFLQTEQTLDADQLKVALERLQTIGKAAVDRFVQCAADNYKVAEARAKAIFENLKKAQPNLQPLLERVKAQLDALQAELRADPTINEIFAIIQNLVGGLTQAVTKFLQTVGEYVEKFTAILKEWASKFSELINKLTPVVTEAFGNVSRALAAVFNSVFEIFVKLSGQVLEVIKANSGDIQKIFTLFAEFFREQSKVVGEIVNELTQYVNELIKTIIKQLESQPVLEKLKERYDEIYKLFLERFEGVFLEIADTLKESIPNAELKEVAEALYGYLEKKLKGQTVDDIAELRKIVERLIKVITTQLNLPASTGVPGLQGLNFENLLKFSVAPANFDSLINLPQFASFRLSLFELLGASDLPTASEILFTYSVPRHVDDVIPPHRAYAQISGSKHVYTFDGDHYTLKGDCQYLLARDFDDGNFSLTAELAGGQLKSVAYVDALDTVEIQADHTVVVNGQPAELPLHQNDISVFRTLNAVNIKSKFGVEVVCDLHQSLVTFTINGYYFGKTRGLLGTISNEKYDDWTLPNGQIASTASQFASAYALSESCQNQVPVEHKHVANTECANAFTAPAAYSECFSFVDRTPYRQGCEDAIEEAQTPEQKTAAICNAAAAYVAKCREATFLLPTIPKSCAKCNLGSSSIDVGKTAVVKTGGKVDAVILVEQTAENSAAFNDLALPLAAEVKKELAGKGFSDINAALIGYGAPGQRYPSLFTTGGQFALDVTSPPKQLKFGPVEGAPAGVSTHPLLAYLNRAKEFSALELGLTPLAQAFRQVLEYPFRADAAKAVILVRNSECHKTNLPVALQQVVFLQARAFFKDRGIVVGLLQPIDISTTGSEKKIAGFDSDVAIVYTKKGVDAASRGSLDYSSDTCAPFIDIVRPVVISTKAFSELKAGPKKQFITSAAGRFATLLAAENTQSCYCGFHEGLHAQTTCSVSATKPLGKKN